MIRTLADQRQLDGGVWSWERGEMPGMEPGSILARTSHLTLPPCFSTVPWKRELWIIAEIYELNKELSTFVIEYSGACLSLLHCLKASVHSRFHFLEREKLVFAASLPGDILGCSSVTGFPSVPSP